jgi:hypothetical protein
MAADEVHEDHRHEVTVFVTVLNDETGESHEEDNQVESGETKVVRIKAELGVLEASALWVQKGDGRSHQLADHVTYDVREGDHFDVIVRGGVS